MKNQVTIHLHTVIEDNGLKETSTVKQIGNFYQKNNMDVLAFEEKVEGDHAIKSMITIQPGKVNIKRSGIVSMNQQFRSEKVTENVYNHPHGHIHMETFTKSIDYQALSGEQAGHLKVEYTVKLNGQDERNHTLTLTFNKEEEE
ncbi:DUF1934 domain-containing protein [Ornithinibacillus sp. BX22]|uniref:DUF1934 domain-containing protein n=1 Tax=Ornithinibacillus hominis TaxID=2763055 RepID=A0A923RFQ6_9BACI|nr:DUF1934 domain-containing protein [Ornithinibacillus hominis]MBC5635599.1 DUF1934 domain-containing protein [Ornithinibacillus hominis]